MENIINTGDQDIEKKDNEITSEGFSDDDMEMAELLQLARLMRKFKSNDNGAININNIKIVNGDYNPSPNRQHNVTCVNDTPSSYPIPEVSLDTAVSFIEKLMNKFNKN